MTLTALKATERTAALTLAFTAIGATGDTKMPRSGSNTDPIAWEFHVASHLARQAEARKKKAHAACVAAGLIFDHDSEPKPPGTSEVVYAGEVVEIAVSVSNPTAKLDGTLFIAALIEAGVSRKLIDRVRAMHTYENKAPHKFTSALVTA